MFAFTKKLKSLLPAQSTLPGRAAKMAVPAKHFVNGHPLEAPFPAGMQLAQFGLGCFWGAERLFWQHPGRVLAPRSATPAARRRTRPTRRSAAASPTTPRRCWWCSTRSRSATKQLLKVFWEGHDPTQGMRQGNDAGTQYRSAIYTYGDEQLQAALRVQGSVSKRR